MPVDRSGHATGTLIVGANGKLAAPVRPGKVNLADTPATLLGKNVGKGVKPITFRGQGGLIYANGQKFAIKGANWFGSEDRNGPMQGLDEHSITFYLAFLRQHGFNAVRLLFNHESVLSNAKIQADRDKDKGKKKGAPKKKTIVASKQSANDYGDDYDDFGDF